ncbi:hypothetical protein [Methanobrevibacter sp.]
MNYENMDLEQLIDNSVNVGEHISVDDILDNVVEDDTADESEFILNEAESNKVITGLVNDSSISDDYWEEKVQHNRDDLCYQLEQYGCIDVKEIAAFHGSVVYQMVEKYL